MVTICGRCHDNFCLFIIASLCLRPHRAASRATHSALAYDQAEDNHGDDASGLRKFERDEGPVVFCSRLVLISWVRTNDVLSNRSYQAGERWLCCSCRWRVARSLDALGSQSGVCVGIVDCRTWCPPVCYSCCVWPVAGSVPGSTMACPAAGQNPRVPESPTMPKSFFNIHNYKSY